MKCAECCYYWQNDDENRPCCHWEARCAGDMAPCEEPEWPETDAEEWDEPADIDDDMGFDPYEGCYTWDC